MQTAEELSNDIQALKDRNARVEGDKAWETSWFRRSIIAAGTYVVMAVFLTLIKAPNPLLASAIPPIGYLLSTLSLPFLKDLWLAQRNK